MTTEGLAKVAAHVADLGYDLVETAIEVPGGYQLVIDITIASTHSFAVLTSSWKNLRCPSPIN